MLDYYNSKPPFYSNISTNSQNKNPQSFKVLCVPVFTCCHFHTAGTTSKSSTPDKIYEEIEILKKRQLSDEMQIQCFLFLPLAWDNTLALFLIDLSSLTLDLLILGAEWMKETLLEELVGLLLVDQLRVIAQTTFVLVAHHCLEADEQNQKSCGLLDHF